MNRYFQQLNYQFSNEFLSEITDIVNFFTQEHYINTGPEFGNIWTAMLSESNLIDVPFYNLFKDFPTISMILKTDSNYFFNWHIDRYRGCAINIPLNGLEKSITLFGKEYKTHYTELVKVPYLKGIPILLNTQEMHCVMNLDEEPRHILSIGFKHPVKYEEVLSVLIENGYI